MALMANVTRSQPNPTSILKKLVGDKCPATGISWSGGGGICGWLVCSSVPLFRVCCGGMGCDSASICGWGAPCSICACTQGCATILVRVKDVPTWHLVLSTALRTHAHTHTHTHTHIHARAHTHCMHFDRHHHYSLCGLFQQRLRGWTTLEG